MNSNNKDIEIIINILKLMKNQDEDANDFKIDPGGLKYLLGQILRQLQIPQEKLYFSYRARLLWNEIRSISKDSTFDYYYQKRVVHENETPIKVLTYKGASSTPVERLLKKDEWFRFRQVFHDDHVILMKLIVERLIQLNEPKYENVMEVLKHISVCRMLNSEDRKIKEKSKRPFSEHEIIENIYLKYGIFIRGYAYSYLNDSLYDESEKSRHLHIPDAIIESYLPHPETYGESLIRLDNGMVTDIYKDDFGKGYSITNDDDLIAYVMMREKFVIA